MRELEPLRGSEEFQRVFKGGRSLANRVAVLYFLPNGVGKVRSGLVTSRKLGKAVVRNRVRRRFREVLRRHRAALGGGWDIVIVARRRSREAPWPEIEGSLVALLKQAGVYQQP